MSATLEPERALADRCPVMARLVATQPPFAIPSSDRERSPFEALSRAVVFQQLSGKAAQTILNRVIALFPGQTFFSPEPLLALEDDQLRGAGLSRQKVAALKDIAEKTLSGEIPAQGELDHLDDEAIIARLTAARGVGRWTAEMYLIFTLARADVWPSSDLGVRKGAEIAYGQSFTPRTLQAFGERFSPHRSAAAWHLWRVLDRPS
jgi:DNA-3-methyladenine glycosylase II